MIRKQGFVKHVDLKGMHILCTQATHQNYRWWEKSCMWKMQNQNTGTEIPPVPPDVNIEFAALTSNVIKKIQTTIEPLSFY